MKPEKQRIAIAEVCGWKKVSHQHSVDWEHWDKDGWFAEPPDYPNDLNAMRDAWESLDYAGKVVFINFLAIEIVKERKPKLKDMQDCIHVYAIGAKPQQWAKAYLRTIGKWEDE